MNTVVQRVCKYKNHTLVTQPPHTHKHNPYKQKFASLLQTAQYLGLDDVSTDRARCHTLNTHIILQHAEERCLSITNKDADV